MKKLTIAECAQKYGTATFNIDECRIGSEEIVSNGYASGMKNGESENGVLGKFNENHKPTTNTGRFPTNLLLSHSPECEEGNCAEGCPCKLLDEQSGITKTKLKMTDAGEGAGMIAKYDGRKKMPTITKKEKVIRTYEGEGGASRFFKQFDGDSNE